ncbi:hypothetical protein DLAC_09071 [Tieghemostelium lacteum]|uniref:Uncharacterized protein n=1 Tax=Tieghemostelium lacteum TaxID=361077 RepID=A0A151Z925_TIELA|nr:hypothetical protein DLAC_09071 [Tieghemostelium lacteum]|eukprot:KYQ90448.1 hypothetical protein DLAC_09071 [Tieghemostelium lacteum]
MKLIILLIAISFAVLATCQPENLYIYDLNDGKIQLTLINIESGEVNKTMLPSIKTREYELMKFLNVNQNGNFIILVMNDQDAYAYIEITPAGQVVNTTQFIQPFPLSYLFYETSVQFDEARNSMYMVVESYQDVILVWDYNTISNSLVNLTMSLEIPPNGCFDGLNTYYILDIDSSQYSNFTLYSYSFDTKESSPGLTINGISPSTDTYLLCANNQVYAVGYNAYVATEMSMYLLDTTNGEATLAVNFQNTGLQNSLNYWTKDNYFVMMTQADHQFYLTMIDLNTNTVVSKSQIQKKFVVSPEASGIN